MARSSALKASLFGPPVQSPDVAALEAKIAALENKMASGAATTLGKAFADAEDYHVPDSGDTALSSSAYIFTTPERTTKLLSIEFQYHRPNDTHVDYWYLTTDFLKGISDGTIPNDTDGWNYRISGYWHMIIKYFFGGWAFYFSWIYHDNNSIEIRLSTSGHNGIYDNIICRYDSSPLHKLSDAELQSKTITTPGVIDPAGIHRAIITPIENRIKALEDTVG